MHNSTRRQFLSLTASTALLPLLGKSAMAAGFPDHPVTIVTGSSPGGGGDLISRLMAKVLSEAWGQPVVVENQPGAAQSIAAGYVAKSAPDGYTLLLVPSTILSAALRTDLTFDIEKDLAPLALLTTSAGVLIVNANSPIKNIKDLIEQAKARPGEITYGTAGVGSPGHFAGELLNKMAGIQLQHVPFKSGVDSIVAVANGEIDIGTPGVGGTEAMIEAGKIRPIAVTTKTRLSALPDVPTVDESGLPGFDYGSWHGMFAPSGVTKELRDQLHQTIIKVSDNPEIKKALADQGYEPSPYYTPEQFATKLHEDLQQTVELAKEIGLQP
ncbi:MAG: tripartite tricarboxylate transporter substrate binding protein [Rhizobiaceae bacterium]|nr:tripartite tricarboxylate transporter substrate binding protein [Rhizobiaceae bacterium]